jgi:Ser/Thr protein kinase RdoA (MazF antagonist)
LNLSCKLRLVFSQKLPFPYNISMQSDEAYFKKTHSTLSTPANQIKVVIEKATKSGILCMQRLFVGEVSEVYDIKLENGSNIILRIARGAVPQYEQERWAIKHCSEVGGIPAPSIIDIQQFPQEDGYLSFCLQAKLPGSPLEGGSILLQAMNVRRKRSILHQVGSILSRIHEVETSGFGPINGEGQGPFSTCSAFLASEHLHEEEEFQSIAIQIGLDPGVIKRVFTVLNRELPLLGDVSARLSHEDILPRHNLVDENDHITGIVDWGDARSDSRINDFAKWDYYVKELPLAWLKEGCGDQSLFDERFELLLHLIKLKRGLGVLQWYYQHGYAQRVAWAKIELLYVLQFFD